MTIFDEMAADVVEIFAEFGKTIRINDTHFSALVAEPELSLELEAGGFNSAGNFTVKMLRSDWLVSKPVVGTLITYDEKPFRVIRIVSRPPHPLVIMTVEPV